MQAKKSPNQTSKSRKYQNLRSQSDSMAETAKKASRHAKPDAQERIPPAAEAARFSSLETCLGRVPRGKFIDT